MALSAVMFSDQVMVGTYVYPSESSDILWESAVAWRCDASDLKMLLSELRHDVENWPVDKGGVSSYVDPSI